MLKKTSKYPPKTLVKLQPVHIYAATFVDGEQSSDTRLIAKMGDNVHFLHPEGVDNKVRQPAKWLREQVIIQSGSIESNTPVEVPADDDVSALPTGFGLEE